MFSLRLIKETTHLARRLSSLSVHSNTLKPATIAYNPFRLDVNNAPVNVRSHILPTDITPPGWANGGAPKIEMPLVPVAVEEPVARIVQEIMDKIQPAVQDLEMPTGVNNGGAGEEGIQAAVLIGIRRRKMKKHKLKKLRKKMKFEWAKVRQRRELRKEKAFQAVLIAQCKEAEKFSAEAYVAEKLRQANDTPIPRFWKGRRLPEFLIREKLGLN